MTGSIILKSYTHKTAARQIAANGVSGSVNIFYTYFRRGGHANSLEHGAISELDAGRAGALFAYKYLAAFSNV